MLLISHFLNSTRIKEANFSLKVKWETTARFTKAIGPLGEGSGVRTLALRTCKADVVVGLHEGEDERLRSSFDRESVMEARKWAWSGKWAVISFCDGKSC